MRRFKITSNRGEYQGVEFEVPDEDTICDAAFDAVAEHLSYGWEEIIEDKEQPKESHV